MHPPAGSVENEGLQAAIGVDSYPRVAAEGAPERCELVPDAIRRCLPRVPQRVVGTAGEGFQPSVRVTGNRRRPGQDATKGDPTGPSTTRRHLPAVPKGLVATAREHLQAPVGVDARGSVGGGAPTPRAGADPSGPS